MFCWRASASVLVSMNRGKANHRDPPQVTGPSALPGNRGGGPSGSGWLVARVPVAWSKITIGPQSDTPTAGPRLARRASWLLQTIAGQAAVEPVPPRPLRYQAARAAAEC